MWNPFRAFRRKHTITLELDDAVDARIIPYLARLPWLLTLDSHDAVAEFIDHLRSIKYHVRAVHRTLDDMELLQLQVADYHAGSKSILADVLQGKDFDEEKAAAAVSKRNVAPMTKDNDQLTLIAERMEEARARRRDTTLTLRKAGNK